MKEISFSCRSRMRLALGRLSAAGVLAFLPAAMAPAASWAVGGADAFDFLLIDPNARSVAMGGAYTALAEDANALSYNPAGLGRVTRHEVTVMHNEHVQGLSQQYVGFAARQGWGANLNYHSFGGVTRTTLAERDGALGEIELTDFAVGAGYGMSLTETVSVGAGLKYIHESIDDLSADGAALDLGALYSPLKAPGFSVGAAALHIGPDVQVEGRKEKLPLRVRLGSAYRFSLPKYQSIENTVALDVSKTRLGSAQVGFGLEAVLSRTGALRLGFTTQNDSGVGIAGGFGLMYQGFRFDYAVSPFGDLGAAHHLSLTVRWGLLRAKASPSRAGRPGAGHAGAADNGKRN